MATPDVSELLSKAVLWQVSLEDCASCGRVSGYILPILYSDASTGERSRVLQYTFKQISKTSNNQDDGERKKQMLEGPG